MKASKSADIAAITLSIICLLHCLLVPVLAAFAPLLAQLFGGHHHHLTHLLFFILALPLTLLAFVKNYQKPSSRLPIKLAALGLGSMGLGISHWLGEHSEVVLTVIGVSLLALAHWLNWRAQSQPQQQTSH